MQLDVIRLKEIKDTTLGQMLINGKHECFTLEDKQREIQPDGTGKIFGETAIPCGTYDIIIAQSPNFKREMPLLLNVPHFTGILIHGGNSKEDTHGCILVGDTLDEGLARIRSGTSKVAFLRIFDKIKTAIQAGEKVTVTVTSKI